MREFRIAYAEKGESVIVCGANAFDEIKRIPARKFVFTDETVERLYREERKRCFGDAPVYAMKPGEENKNETTLFSLLAAMADAGMHRGDCLVCLGGGVVGDIGGLASALYMRGTGCVQIPTTLLAQVDSSVGGKTAVDFKGVKNLVGVFKQPERVLVDGRFLKTLPARELRCGLGEIVKHAALNGALFEKLQAARENLFDLDFLAEIVPDNIAVKAEVVRKDPKETGLRKCLNLGHTTAHALELFDGKLSHGEYVLIGILFEAELAKRYAACDEAYLHALQTLTRAVLGGVPALPDMRAAAKYAKLDKKNAESGVVVVTAPCKKGEYTELELPYGEYENALCTIREELC